MPMPDLTGLPEGSNPPIDENDYENRVNGFMGFFQRLRDDPTMNAFFLQMGTNLMQPLRGGQTPAGHLGRAIQAGSYAAGEQSALLQEAYEKEQELAELEANRQLERELTTQRETGENRRLQAQLASDTALEEARGAREERLAGAERDFQLGLEKIRAAREAANLGAELAQDARQFAEQQRKLAELYELNQGEARLEAIKLAREHSIDLEGNVIPDLYKANLEANLTALGQDPKVYLELAKPSIDDAELEQRVNLAAETIRAGRATREQAVATLQSKVRKESAERAIARLDEKLAEKPEEKIAPPKSAARQRLEESKKKKKEAETTAAKERRIQASIERASEMLEEPAFAGGRGTSIPADKRRLEARFDELDAILDELAKDDPRRATIEELQDKLVTELEKVGG